MPISDTAPNVTAKDTAPEDSDLVVVDRNMLLKLLSALMCSLESSQTLDQIASQSNLDPPPVAQKRDEISRARVEIAKGMRSLQAGVADLPKVTLKKKAG